MRTSSRLIPVDAARVSGVAARFIGADPVGGRASTGRRSLSALLTASTVAAVLLCLKTASLLPLALPPALGVLLWCVARPRVAAVLVLIAWAGPLALPTQSTYVGGLLRVGVGDAALWSGLAGLVIAALLGVGVRRPRQRVTFGWVTLAFLGAVTWGVLNGMRHGGGPGVALNTWLACASCLSYFLFRGAYAGRPHTLARDLVVVGGVASAVVVVAALVGFAPLAGTNLGHVYTRGARADIARIDAPALRLIIVSLLLVVVGGVLRTGRLVRLRWPLAIAMVALLIMSLTRSTWLPVIAAVVVLPAAVAKSGRLQVLLRRVTATGAVGLLALTLAQGGVFGTWGTVAATRIVSATDDNVFQDDSYRYRAVENDTALTRISEHPIAGIGLPRTYGAVVPQQDAVHDRIVYVQKDFIHNTYLGIWMWLGLPGLVAVVFLAVHVLVTAAQVMKRQHRHLAVPIAALGAIGALGLMASFQSNMVYPPAYVVFAAALALLDLWLESSRSLDDRDLGEVSPARATRR